MKPLVGRNLQNLKKNLRLADKYLRRAERLSLGAYGSHGLTSDMANATVMRGRSREVKASEIVTPQSALDNRRSPLIAGTSVEYAVKAGGSVLNHRRFASPEDAYFLVKKERKPSKGDAYRRAAMELNELRFKLKSEQPKDACERIKQICREGVLCRAEDLLREAAKTIEGK